MTHKEAQRYEVIKDLIARKLDGTEAAKILFLSVRQVKRIKARVKESKILGVIHGNRGKVGHHCLDEKIVQEAKEYLHNSYSDFNPLLAQEKLSERHQILFSKEKVRQLMIEEKLWKPKKKAAFRKFSWRERKDNYGEMEQFDGSYHNWFEGRNEEEVGLEQCLLVAVDDATGRLTKAHFEANEGVGAVFRFWQGYFKDSGLPLAIYLDKFSTYKVNHQNAVDNEDLMTQFERAMRQLEIRVIHANTPQAKGRVEKMNGTLQRRLVKELRLNSIDTISEANEFLKNVFIPKFNLQFGVKAKKPSDLHRRLDKKEIELEKILSIQSKRTVNNDYTIRFKNKYYQLNLQQPQTTVYKRDAVTVEERLNGEIKISLGDKYLDFTQLPARPEKEIKIQLAALTNRPPTAWKPPINHPWRAYVLNNKKQPIPMAVNNGSAQKVTF